MSPDVCGCVCGQVEALETIVEPKTENVFTSGFWRSQDWITNALDNVKARLYVDHQCVVYNKVGPCLLLDVDCV